MSSSTSEAIRTVRSTATGALEKAMEAKQQVDEIVNDAKERAGNIKEGVRKMEEGKELIRKGVNGE